MQIKSIQSKNYIIPTFCGQLTLLQNKKKDPGNLSKNIIIIQNNISEILIRLFVPQKEFIQKLIFVFDLYFNNPNLYFTILQEQDFFFIQSDYIKQLAKNVEYLRKSKEKAIIDREFIREIAGLGKKNKLENNDFAFKILNDNFEEDIYKKENLHLSDLFTLFYFLRYIWNLKEQLG